MLAIDKKSYLKVFLITFIMAMLMMLPLLIMGNGYLNYYGDFNAQQIPFYELCNEAIKSGDTGWNWQTDLGVNFIGSYSFYTLGSPFFWLTVIFPAEISKYFLAPLMAAKMGLASLFAFMFIKRFVKKAESAFIGGILYAFSGFSIYNIVFNHFHEAICFFPLLLIGLEEAVINKRKAVFAFAVALNALVNYFFFVGECVFLVLYFIMRISMSKDFRIRVSDFFCIAFESVVGVLAAGVLLIPSVYQMFSMPRATNMLTDLDFLFYGGDAQIYGNIIKSFFFVTDIAGRNSLLPAISYNWTSNAFFLPLFAMTGVCAFMCGAKKHWAKGLIIACAVMAFVPGLNSMFVLFNSTYYTRWFYMPSLICCLATVYALENKERCSFKKGFAINGGIFALFSLLILFYPIHCEYDEFDLDGNVVNHVNEVFPNFMAHNMNDEYTTIIATAVVLAVLYILIRNCDKLTEERFMRRITVSTLAMSLLLGMGAMLYGRLDMGVDTALLEEAYYHDIEIDDDDFYRIEIVTESGFGSNANMCLGLNSANSFHSIVPTGIQELHEYLCVGSQDRQAVSEAAPKYFAYRSLTGVKYIIADGDAGFTEDNIQEKIPTFSYYDTQGEYLIYKNDYLLPMGFAYDNYILYQDTADKWEKIVFDSTSMIDRIACNSVALTLQQSEKYADILTEIPDDSIAVESWTFERFEQDVAARQAAGVKDFKVGKNCFSASTDYTSDELVVFSVPYDKGWSVTIDGEPAEIDKVNGGMMAVRVAAGEHKLEFTYTTPGLMLGIICSAAALILLAVWAVLWYAVLRKGYVKNASAANGGTISAHAEYIRKITEASE